VSAKFSQTLPGIITGDIDFARNGTCIALRYTVKVSAGITTEEFRALAELRYRIRHFLSEGDATARAAGLEPQQYLLLLMIHGLPEGQQATIRTLAERLALKHHSVVELIDRLQARGYVRRTRGHDDRRRVLVSLLPRGQRMLEGVARQRINELRSYGRQLVQAIDQLLDRPQKPHGHKGAKKSATARSREKRGRVVTRKTETKVPH
jgi:DNA-binding MarR family transcriptional regulator